MKTAIGKTLQVSMPASVPSAKVYESPEARTPGGEPWDVDAIAASGTAFRHHRNIPVHVRNMGIVMEPREVPALYGVLQPIFDALARAQENAASPHQASANRLYIVDRPAAKAKVYSSSQSGVRSVQNDVVITTGMLRKMLGVTPSDVSRSGELPPEARERFRTGVLRIAGVVMNELARGVLNDQLAGGQIEALRADAASTLLGMEAGFAANARLEAVKHGAVTGGGALSADPEVELRLAGLRMLLTKHRKDNGLEDPAPLEIPPAAMARFVGELSTLSKYRDARSLRPPESFTQAVSRVREHLDSIDDIEEGSWNELELNRLILATDALLLARERDQRPLNASEKQALHDYVRLLITDARKIYDRQAKNRFMTPFNASEEFANVPTHAEYLRKIRVFSSGEVGSWVAETVDGVLRDGGWQGDLDWTLKLASKVLPPRALASRYRTEILRELEQHTLGGAGLWYSLDDISPGFELYVTILWASEVWPNLKADERIDAIQNAGSGRTDMPFPSHWRRDSGRNERNLERRRLMRVLKEDDKRAYNQIKEFYRHLWDNKGEVALAALARSDSFDWDWLIEVLDLDPQRAKSQLRSAVKSMTAPSKHSGDSDSRFVEMVRTIADSKLKRFSMHPTGARNGDGNPVWMDPSFYHHLAGDKHPAIRDDPALAHVAKAWFAAPFLREHPERARALYTERFEAALEKAWQRVASGTPRERASAASTETLRTLHEEVCRSLTGDPGSCKFYAAAEVQAELIDASPISTELKKTALRGLFLEDVDEIDDLREGNYWWWTLTSLIDRGRIFELLQKHGLVDSPTTFLERLLDDSNSLGGYDKEVFRTVAARSDYSSYFSLVNSLAGPLEAEVDVIRRAPGEKQWKFERLMALCSAVFPGNRDNMSENFADSAELRLLRGQIVDAALELELTDPQCELLFRALTLPKATPETDRLFTERVLPAATRKNDWTAVGRHLGYGRVDSASLALSLAKRVLEPRLAELERLPRVQNDDLDDLVQSLNHYAPTGSSEKDAYLETMAWRLKVEGVALEAFIEDRKSSNVKTADPRAANLASGVVSQLSELSAEDRHDFIRYLMRPPTGDYKKAELPKKVQRTLVQNAERVVWAERRAKGEHLDTESIRREANERALGAKYRLETAVREMTPLERVPFFEVLIRAGHRNLYEDPEFPLRIATEHLGMTEDSWQYQSLVAYLKVVPEEERSVTVSYLLSQSGSDKSGVANLFEAFGSVGKKFAQLGSVWKIFDEQTSNELARIKDRAQPMSKHEILQVINDPVNGLSTAERKRIKRLKKVLGAASMKTVVLVEIDDGKGGTRDVVMMVQPPNLRRQIETNLRFAEVFKTVMESSGQKLASALVGTIIAALKEQLTEELEMTREGPKFEKAAELFRSIGQEIGANISVPALVKGFEVRDNVMFVERVDEVGPEDARRRTVTFHRRKKDGTDEAALGEPLRARVGENIVRSSLRMLFQHGWFDPDRHDGNQLIDPENGDLYPIDFGQLECFDAKHALKWDPRLTLASFMQALRAGDASTLVREGLRMSTRESARAADTKALEADAKRILEAARGSPTGWREAIVEIVESFARHDVTFEKRFSFGALKGLMTLAGEGYVAPNEFERIMEEEIGRLLYAKVLPALPIVARTMRARLLGGMY